MKTKGYLLAGICLCVVMSLQSQVFVGGVLGVDYTKQKQKSTNPAVGNSDGLSGFGFGVIPKVGYQIDDNLAVGAFFGYSYGRVKDPTTSFNINVGGTNIPVPTPTKISGSMLEIGAFARYYLVNKDKVGLFVEMEMGVGSGRSKQEFRVETDGPDFFMFDVNVAPVVEIKINESISFETKLNFAGLGYRLGKMKYLDATGLFEVTDSQTDVYFGIENTDGFGNVRLVDQELQNMYGANGINLFGAFTPPVHMGLVFRL